MSDSDSEACFCTWTENKSLIFGLLWCHGEIFISTNKRCSTRSGSPQTLNCRAGNFWSQIIYVHPFWVTLGLNDWGLWPEAFSQLLLFNELTDRPSQVSVTNYILNQPVSETSWQNKILPVGNRMFGFALCCMRKRITNWRRDVPDVLTMWAAASIRLGRRNRIDLFVQAALTVEPECLQSYCERRGQQTCSQSE